MAAPACPSCGAELVGTFCHQCGERALRERDKSLWDFLTQSLLTLAEADSGLRRSFSALFLKPGLLTKEYAEGRRVNYLKPIQLFLLANLCYFLVQPLTGYQGYNTQLDAQVTRQIYSQTLGLGELVDRRIEAQGTTRESYTAAFNAKSEVLARTLIFTMLPLFALILSLVFLKRKRAIDHLVFAVHYYSFDLIAVGCVFLLAWPWALEGVNLAMEGISPDNRVQVVSALLEVGPLLVMLPYLYLSIRRFYGIHKMRAAISAVILTAGVLFTTFCYRAFLFFVTYAAI